MCARLGAVSLLVGAAWVITFIGVPLQWLNQSAIGPLAIVTGESAREARGLHLTTSISVTPSYAPVHHDQQKEQANRIVGIVLFIHLMVLTLSIFAYWQYGEHYRLERARLEENDSVDDN
jgi:uncharacterized membrane protein AbrB (regulator of aidB expression)